MSRRIKVKKPELPPEVEDIKTGFELFNSKTGGVVDPNELIRQLQILGLDSKHPSVYNLLCELVETPEIMEKGGLTYEDYVEYVRKKLSDRETRDGCRKLYEFLNNDPHADTIPFSALVRVANELKEETTEKELKELLEKAESFGGELTFEEFYQIMSTKSFT